MGATIEGAVVVGTDAADAAQVAAAHTSTITAVVVAATVAVPVVGAPVARLAAAADLDVVMAAAT